MMIDVVGLLQQELNFTVFPVQSFDGSFGVKLDNGSWTGIVKMLIDKDIDVSVVDLSVTADRAEVSDTIKIQHPNQIHFRL